MRSQTLQSGRILLHYRQGKYSTWTTKKQHLIGSEYVKIISFVASNDTYRKRKSEAQVAKQREPDEALPIICQAMGAKRDLSLWSRR